MRLTIQHKVVKQAHGERVLSVMSKCCVLVVGIMSLTGCHYTVEKDLHLASVSGRAVDATLASNTIYEIIPRDIGFDLKSGRITYTLDEPALVRIRIGIRDGGALLVNLLDWEYRDAGDHVEVWDKKDASGLIDFSHRQDLISVVSCHSPGSVQLDRDYVNGKGYRNAPRLDVTFPESVARTDDGLAVLSGMTPVRITVNPEDQAWLRQTKFELGMYVDYVFLMEDEEGTNPFTYQMKTTDFNNGRHTLTVNIVGYKGEVGMVSLDVYVKNNEETSEGKPTLPKAPYILTQTIRSWQDAGVEVGFIDVREPSEYADGHLDGAMNIPYRDIEARAVEISRVVPQVLYCIYSSWRAPYAANALADLGFKNVYVLDGGIAAWNAGGQVVYPYPKNLEKKFDHPPSREYETKIYLSPHELAQYDGKNGRLAYVAVDGVIYDLTQSRLWRGGEHDPSKGKAIAGRDLTEVLKDSPHGDKYLKNFPVVGYVK